MTLASLLAFAAVYCAAVASPGPGVAAIVARVLAHGYTGLPAFIAGFVVGDLVWFVVAAAGLSVVAQQFAGIFLAVKYAGAAYLLFMAWKLWSAPVKVGQAPAAETATLRAFLASLSLTLGNPKVIVFFLALLPTVVDLGALTLSAFFILAAMIALILCAVMCAYALGAAQARALFTSAPAMRRLNRAGGALMAGVALTVAAR